MAKDNDSKGPQDSFFGNRRGMLIVSLVLVAVVLLSLLSSPLITGEHPITYSELKQKVVADNVESVEIHEFHIIAHPTQEALEIAQAESSEDQIKFKSWRANLVRQDESFIPLLEEHKIKYEAFNPPDCGGGDMMMWFLPLMLMLVFFSFFMRRMGGAQGQNAAADFGKSRAKLNIEEGTGVTFADVAGCDEAKEELEEIIHFLKEPERFTRLGGKVPKGVLLVGPPGTGKTLLARAVAGEASVPFLNLSGSDFVEMFVGVGAARVRDLFTQAKTHAPCIIFVDELDAIGKTRGSGMQSNEEREQTLNALLVEMDGFDSNSNVIVLAATNRPEVLDTALMRPGRFDRQVVVDRPDVKGRLAILKVHARAVVLEENVDLEFIADQTPGFVGADLANIVNEAALLAARNDKDSVEGVDFQEAIERVIAGLERKSRRLGPKEKNIVAYHETGHAIVSKSIAGSDEVKKVSIVSRGIAALGYTLQVPAEDRYLMTRLELDAKICGLLGGRAAEEIILGDVSTGASNDLQRVTAIARSIVVDYGMSQSLGHVSYADSQDQFLGQMGASNRKYSEKTALMIDEEVHTLIDSMYTRTMTILHANHDLLVEMSEHLKDVEVLDGEELESFLSRVKPFSEMGTDGSAEVTATT